MRYATYHEIKTPWTLLLLLPSKKYTLIHPVVCLTTGPQPLPKKSFPNSAIYC